MISTTRTLARGAVTLHCHRGRGLVRSYLSGRGPAATARTFQSRRRPDRTVRASPSQSARLVTRGILAHGYAAGKPPPGRIAARASPARMPGQARQGRRCPDATRPGSTQASDASTEPPPARQGANPKGSTATPPWQLRSEALLISASRGVRAVRSGRRPRARGSSRRAAAPPAAAWPRRLHQTSGRGYPSRRCGRRLRSSSRHSCHRSS